MLRSARRHPTRSLLAALTGLAVLYSSTPTMAQTPAMRGIEPWSNITPGSTLVLQPGEVRSIPVDQIERVAIGNPDVIDFTILSPSEILLKAKAAGRTNLILWERAGQRSFSVEVTNVTLEGVEQHVTELLQELRIQGVRLRRQGDKLFLIGEVAPAEMERLQQLVESFPGQVVNLVRTAAEVPAVSPGELPQSVRLSMQVIEMNRRDIEQLGVSWPQEYSFTDQAITDQTMRKALSRWGTSVDRPELKLTIKALVTKNRARILAEPKLVTASGKEASSFVGLDVPILTSTTETEQGAASTNVEFRQTGVLLTMTPTVHTGTQHRKITTVIKAEISGIDTGSAVTLLGQQIPGFRVRKANTEVTAESGETVVIAGLLEAEDSNTLSQVPALGSMPVIGRLFRSPANNTIEREIIIAMTPELLGEENVSTDRLMALEHALGKDIETPGDKPLYEYATQVQQHLAEGIGYPESIKAAGTSGRVKLRLHLRENGVLNEVTVAEPSGVKEFDEEALNAAKRQAPYPPIPEAVGRPDVWLDVPVIFNPLALDQAIGEAFGQAIQAGLPEDSPLRRYAAALQERLARGIQYPEREKQLGAAGQVNVRLHVMRTGALADAVVVGSSGVPPLDRAALEAAVRQSPYPPFPKEVAQPEVWLDLPVLFSP